MAQQCRSAETSPLSTYSRLSVLSNIRRHLLNAIKQVVPYVTNILLECIIVQEDIMYLFFSHPTGHKMPILVPWRLNNAKYRIFLRLFLLSKLYT